MKKVGRKVAIIVVTHNRAELLDECLSALMEQSYQNFSVFVIDNASTDNTSKIVKKYNSEKVVYHHLDKNIGGAGGFNYGLKVAYFEGYQYFWLIDDDCIVQNNSLAKLMEADDILGGNYGFLSNIVLWKDGTQCIMNRQKIPKTWWKESNQLKDSLIMTYYASFVGFFTTRIILDKYGLPFKEFFIWGDDVEYSNRISKTENCYIVGNSQVVHKTANNNGSNIAVENNISRLPRYYYAFRNECVVARENGIKGRVHQFSKVNYYILKVIFGASKKKIKKLHIILSGTIAGLFFRPKIEFVEVKENEA